MSKSNACPRRARQLRNVRASLLSFPCRHWMQTVMGRRQAAGNTALDRDVSRRQTSVMQTLTGPFI